MTFKITRGTGFQLTLPKNGWTISVQFGPGTYSDHWAESIRPPIKAAGPYDLFEYYWTSETAEIAVWDNRGIWHAADNLAVAGTTDDPMAGIDPKPRCRVAHLVDIIARVAEQDPIPGELVDLNRALNERAKRILGRRKEESDQ